MLLEGFHPVKHALRFGARVHLIVAADPAAVLALTEVLAPDLLGVIGDRMVGASRDMLRRLVGSVPRTEVAALAGGPGQRPALWSADRTAPLVVLDNPRDLGNVGAVVRVVAGLGGSGVLTTGSVDPWHPAVLRGSAGLHFATPVQHAPDGWLAGLAGPVLAFDAAGRDLRDQSIPAGAALIFGSERHGIGVDLRERADALLALPLTPGVSSYNLATAVAMALYHWALGARR